MRRLSSSSQTLLLFLAFVLAGASALAASALILGGLIVEAGDGLAGPLAVIAAGALTGTLASFVIHEITLVAPGIVRALSRRRV
ncbi:MAG: hypothetical protein ABL898_14095 [Hyphomicrobiaceae bacterium]